MGYKYWKRGIRIGFSFPLGMMLLLSGCSGGMKEMQTSQIPEDMGSAAEVEDVNLVELDSSIVELEEGLFAVRYDGDYGFDGFIDQGGASSDGEVIAYLADHLLSGLNLGDLLGGDLAVCAGESQHLVPGGLHRPRLVGVDMAGVGADHPLIGL